MDAHLTICETGEWHVNKFAKEKSPKTVFFFILQNRGQKKQEVAKFNEFAKIISIFKKPITYVGVVEEELNRPCFTTDMAYELPGERKYFQPRQKKIKKTFS